MKGEERNATPGYYLSRIVRSMTRIGDMRLRAVGFVTAQIPVLMALRDGGSLSQGALAALAKVEQPSMAQLLARMERDGLIRRNADPVDRRSSLVSLTQQARERVPLGRAIMKQGNKDMTAGLSEAEIQTLNSLLVRVLRNVEALEA